MTRTLPLLLLLAWRPPADARGSRTSLSARRAPPAAFEFPSLGALFPPNPKTGTAASLKTDLLAAVSGTNNGKTADPARQRAVLSLVGRLERSYPPSSVAGALTDPARLAQLDGTWHLQYTSPSAVDGDGGDDDDGEVWTPVPEPGAKEVEEFRSQGNIRAGGLTVEYDSVPRQIVDVANGRITNEVDLPLGAVTVGGPFRGSPAVPNRAIVDFDTAEIATRLGPVIRFGFVFGIRRLLDNNPNADWLEVTYVDEDVRIGRGNKGTMFVLTRDPEAVVP